MAELDKMTSRDLFRLKSDLKEAMTALDALLAEAVCRDGEEDVAELLLASGVSAGFFKNVLGFGEEFVDEWEKQRKKDLGEED